MSHTPHTKAPSYRRHKATGQAIVTLDGQMFYLGPHGSEVSKRQYDRLIAEWLNNGRTLSHTCSLCLASANGKPLSISQLILAYWRFAETCDSRGAAPAAQKLFVGDLSDQVIQMESTLTMRFS